MSDVLLVVVGGLLSGGLGAFATLAAYAHGVVRFSSLERRRRRMEVAYEALAYRYVLSGREPDPESRHRFNKAMNLIPILFSDDKEVMDRFDALMNNQTEPNYQELMRVIVTRTGMKKGVLANHIMKTITR